MNSLSVSTPSTCQVLATGRHHGFLTECERGCSRSVVAFPASLPWTCSESQTPCLWIPTSQPSTYSIFTSHPNTQGLTFRLHSTPSLNATMVSSGQNGHHLLHKTFPTPSSPGLCCPRAGHRELPGVYGYIGSSLLLLTLGHGPSE